MFTYFYIFFFQAEDGIRNIGVTGVQTCALPISRAPRRGSASRPPRLWDRRPTCLRFSFRRRSRPARLTAGLQGDGADRKSVGEGKSVDLGGRRINKKKKIHLSLEKCTIGTE